MIKKIAIALLLFCFFSGICQAAEINPQSLRDLISLGLHANLGLKVESINVLQQEESIEIEKAVFDSEVFAAAGFDRSSTPYESSLSEADTSNLEMLFGQVGFNKRFESGMTTSLSLNSEWSTDNDYSNALDPHYRTALQLDLNQPLLRNLGRSVNTIGLEISRNQQRQAALTYLLRAQSLILQLETAARQIAGETRIIALRREALRLANDLYAANMKRFDAGVIAVSEVQEAETAQADRELALSQVLQNRDLLLEELNRQMNHSLPTTFNPEVLFVDSIRQEDYVLTDIDSLFDAAREKRLELKINNYSIESTLLQQDYLHNQLKPQLDLSLQAGINGLAGDDGGAVPGSRYDGDWLNSFSSLSETDGYQWRIGINFSMPLGNRSAQSRYRQSQLQTKQDRYRQRDLETLLRNDLRQQQINIVRSEEQLKLARRFEALAQKSLDQEKRRLDEGLSDTFRMIAFQDKMIEAKIGHINAMTRYRLALARMEFVRGNILERHGIVLTQNAEELEIENI